MSDVIIRGTPNLMKAIKKGAEEVSRARGVKIQEPPVTEGGAFNSINSAQINRGGLQPLPQNIQIQEMFTGNKKFDFEKSLNQRTIETLETLSQTGEYFNALQSLVTLYASGNLTEGVMKKLNKEDLKEIKEILREFISVLDHY